jgi:hypothetical protein
VSLPTPDNWRVARARAAAVLGGSDIELIMIDMQTTKRDDYLAKFPAGCVPAFEATDGTIIQQSGAIATYGECRVVRLSDFDLLLLPTFPLFRLCPWPRPGVCFYDEFTTSSYPCLNDFCRQILRRVVSLYF